jgi:hypothetical protein
MAQRTRGDRDGVKREDSAPNQLPAFKVHRVFRYIEHPADFCDFYASQNGESVVEALVHDHLSFTEALANNTVNCILFAADVVYPHDFFEPEVRPPACRVRPRQSMLFPD